MYVIQLLVTVLDETLYRYITYKCDKVFWNGSRFTKTRQPQHLLLLKVI